MRRINKRLFYFSLGVLFTFLYCEYLIYYVVVLQCSWPAIQTNQPDNVLKAFILADIHMLGPWRGHWLDKWRRESQMHKGYQAILTVHQPDVVFLLGDVFDEGEWTNEIQFKEYVDRFYRLFSVPEQVKLFIAVGNHDIGFHSRMRLGAPERFAKMMNSPSTQHIVLKNNHFVLLNSMAMHGDSCNLCMEARYDIQNISSNLECYKDQTYCNSTMKRLNYTPPILMQHFPLYRVSDAVCTEPDAPPLPERNKKFRNKIDSLSKEATNYLVEKIKPRAVFGGHTHHGCLLDHYYRDLSVSFKEYSVPSFSWRNRPDPKYMLVTVAPDVYDVNKCGLPTETAMIVTAMGFLVLTTYLTFQRRLIGR